MTHGARPDAAGADPVVLLVAVNWLGDSLMALPAIQAYRRAHPAARLVVAVKPKLRALWTLCADADAVLDYAEGWRQPWTVAGVLRRGERPTAAFVLPRSWRAALLPWVARVPQRVGLPGHGRDWMLTRVVRPRAEAARRHQQYEYADLLDVPGAALEPPRLTLPAGLTAAVRDRFGLDTARPWVALFPGAARGPAKCWPAAYFVATARHLLRRWRCAIVLCGAAEDRDVCDAMARELAGAAVNAAGRTTLPELAAVTAVCALAIGNDSGGAHLAAAVGTPTVAIFGLTDPARTQPLGAVVRAVRAEGPADRDVPRVSTEAARRLARLLPERVVAAADEALAVAGHRLA